VRSNFIYSFSRAPVAIGSFVIASSLILFAIAAPFISPYTPYDPATLNLMNGFSAPLAPNAFTGDVFIFGSDDQGRDILSTILFGMRISLFVGFSAVFLAMILGVALGLVAAMAGGVIDAIIMRVADIQLSFPSILIAMLIYGIAKGITPPEMRNEVAIWVLILSIGLSDWVQFARVVRGSAMVELQKEYVEAAKLIGVNRVAIAFRHIFPNVVPSVLVIATISLALAIISEATLSFLGVGAPPTQPSLGTLIRIGQGFLFSGEWWIIFFPSLALLLLALSVNLLGDWLRNTLNPNVGIK
jgi:peptide/nickel transport system permease protein